MVCEYKKILLKFIDFYRNHIIEHSEILCYCDKQRAFGLKSPTNKILKYYL